MNPRNVNGSIGTQSDMTEIDLEALGRVVGGDQRRAGVARGIAGAFHTLTRQAAEDLAAQQTWRPLDDIIDSPD